MMECPGHGCLGHAEREALDDYISTVLQERQPTEVNYEGVVNVDTGPNFKTLTLKDVENNYKKSKEWEKIKTSFYCIPNWEKRDFNTKDERQEILERFEKLSLEGNIAQAEVFMQRDKQFKQYEAVLTTETELNLKELIMKSMDGYPGLLLRSIETDKVVSQDKRKNFTELSDLGIKIPIYNCHNPSHTETDHEDQCYRSENDFILLYVEGSTLCIRFIEVKRPNTTPWAKTKKLPGEEMVWKCLEQLKKGVDFILSLIPDIPSEHLDIKAFSAFPETPCASIFCTHCQPKVISLEDVELITAGKKSLRMKLSMPEFHIENSEDGFDRLLSATSRLVGNASLLHGGAKSLSDPFKRDKQKMIQNVVKILNESQRDLLMKITRKSPQVNYCFIGGSGTGKTQMALEVIKKILAMKCQDKKSRRLILSSCQHGDTGLQKLFKSKTFQCNVTVQPFGDLITKLKTNNKDFQRQFTEEYEVPKKRMYKMPKLIAAMCKLLEKDYEHDHVIFFLDEIMAFGNPDSLDWTELDPGPCVTLLLAFSPLSLEKGAKQLVAEGGESDESSEYLKLPTTFEHVKLSKRYRNSRSIQRLSCHIGHQVGKYLISAESPANDVVGEKPPWIDIGANKDRIRPALEHMKTYIDDDRKSEMYLLYDKHISKESKEILTAVEKPRKDGGFGWKVLKENMFHGCECDTVIYVGSGHLEAFTRAKIKLLIITFAEDIDNPWYKTYQSALVSAAKEDLIKEIFC